MGREISPGRKLPCTKCNIHKKTRLKKGMVGGDLFKGGDIFSNYIFVLKKKIKLTVTNSTLFFPQPQWDPSTKCLC